MTTGTPRPPGDGRDFSEIEKAFRDALESRFLEGLIRRFERLFPDHAAEVEDVLYNEILKVVEGTTPLPRDLRAALTWRLRNRMVDVTRRPRRVDVDPDSVDYDTPEERAVRKEFFDRLKAVVDAWENKTMALVIRLTLEAAYYEEILDAPEIREIVLEQLGHDLTVTNVWKLRSRGMKRLVEDVAGLLGEYARDWALPLDLQADDSTDEDEDKGEEE